MKVTKLCFEDEADEKKALPERQGHFVRNIACCIVLAAVASFGIVSCRTEAGEAHDDIVMHEVEEGETIWEIARPIADARGEDIRKTVYRIMESNGIGPNGDIKPGQILIIK